MTFRKPFPKTLTALALLAAGCGAQAQSSVTIYGILDASVRYSDGLDAAYAGSAGSTTMVNSGVNTTSRLGFRGSEDLGGGLAAIFNLESGVNVDSGASANATKYFDRASVVGLRGGFGTLTVGRQTTLLADVVGAVDPLSSRFASFNPNVGIAALSSHRLALEYGPAGSTTGSFRLDNSAKYVGQFGGFSVRAMYALGEQANSSSKLSSTGLGVGYQAGGITTSLAYTEFKTVADLSAKGYLGGVRGKLGSTTLSLTYGKLDAETATTAKTVNKTLGLGATVPLSASLDLVLAHYRLNRTRTGSTDDGFNRTFAYLEYKLSTRSLVYAELDQTAWKNNYQGTGNKSNATGFSLGLKHTF